MNSTSDFIPCLVYIPRTEEQSSLSDGRDFIKRTASSLLLDPWNRVTKVSSVLHATISSSRSKKEKKKTKLNSNAIQLR